MNTSDTKQSTPASANPIGNVRPKDDSKNVVTTGAVQKPAEATPTTSTPARGVASDAAPKPAASPYPKVEQPKSPTPAATPATAGKTS